MSEHDLEFIIPACEGRAFKVRRGQTLRVSLPEGPQACDLVAFNLHHYKETFSAWLTRHIEGSFTKATKLYSKLPGGNVMFTVLTDIEGCLYLNPGGCNRFTYEQLGVKGYHKNCMDILAETIAPYGFTAWDVPDIINIFMNVAFFENGRRELSASPVKEGDYYDIRAEMDMLCAISACPDDMQAYNNFKAKSLGVKVFYQ